MASSTPVACEDITDTLKAMRAIDDKIIYELNLATPTQSFRNEVDPRSHCKLLYQQLNETYAERESMISLCLAESKKKVEAYREQLPQKQNDSMFMRNFRCEQSKIRELQNEMSIEEIIRERSLTAFEERCKHFYKPPKQE